MKAKMKINGKALFFAAASVLLAILFVFSGQFSAFAASADALSENGKFYTEYETLKDAQAAAADMNEEIASEGDVLLKNDGALPANGNEKVSIFGGVQKSLFGTENSSITVGQAFDEAGFRVNPTLRSFYESTDYKFVKGQEETAFNGSVMSSLRSYNDLAIIVISGGNDGGERSDGSRNTGEVEDNKGADGEEYGWEHEALYTDENGTEYKHSLQLTDEEEELVYTVKQAGFKKILVVINSSVPMEIGNLQNDPAINSILWIGRPGANGVKAIPKIVNGTVNPSGKTADIWYKDFTADPTWYNFGDNSQVKSTNKYDTSNTNAAEGGVQQRDASSSEGYFGIEYNEDIYLGYKYTETAHYESQTPTSENTSYSDFVYDNVVNYPFGYGLSYTTFSYNSMKVYTDEACTTELAETATGIAGIDKLYAQVEVENTGNYAGKEVVQIYVTAPYIAGEIEKVHVKLVGFAKTENLRPGQKQTITIEFSTYDIASYDYTDANKDNHKGYEFDAGNYVIRAMTNSHAWVDTSAADYNEVAFKLNAIEHIDTDPYSGEQIQNLFSEENGRYNSLRTNEGIQVNQDTSDNEQQLMSRASFATTFPSLENFTLEQRAKAYTVSQEFIDDVTYYMNYTIDSEGADDANNPEQGWVQDATEAFAEGGVAENWTQTPQTSYPYKLSQLAGIDYTSDEVLTSGVFKGQTGREAWDTFLNTLTYDDLVNVVVNNQNTAFNDFGYNSLIGADNTYNLSSTYAWQDASVVGSTWNTELAEEQGILMANLALLKDSTVNTWWGNGMNTRRSPFAGRAYEYYSQDGILSGYIASAVVQGAQSRGLACYIKHCALNDQETDRSTGAGKSLFVFVSEQAVREQYFRPYQICIQEGGALGIMAGFARVGVVYNGASYNFCTSLIRKEWGFKGSITTDIWLGSGTPELTPYEWVETATLRGSKNNLGGVKAGAGEKKESLVQYYQYRTMARAIMYLHANSACNLNGITFANWEGEDFGTVAQGGAVSVSAAVADADIQSAEKVTYSIASGTLPAGLTLNVSTGAITGTVTGNAGAYEFTVKCTADNWIKDSRSYSMTVTSAFDTEYFETTATVGKAYESVIDNTLTGDKVYSIAEGSNLPDGLAMDETGVISGTPTKAGSYTFTVLATVDGVQYSHELTIEVADGVIVDKTQGIEFRVNEGYIQWKYADENDTNWQNVVSLSDISGTAGVDGKQVEFQTAEGYIQWKYVGDDTWTNLIALSEINSGSSGCKSSVTASAALLGALLLGTAVVFIGKKKKD